MSKELSYEAQDAFVRAFQNPDQEFDRSPLADLKRGVVRDIRIATLNIDCSYQRGLTRISAKISGNWNPHAAGVLKVAERPGGGLWLIDGQQRREAMVKLGIAEWSCEVIPSPGPIYEAIIYTLMNGSEGRKQLTPLDIFRARLLAGNPHAVAVRDAVIAVGLRLKEGSGKSHGKRDPADQVACVSTLYDAVRVHGRPFVDRLLLVNKSSWPGTSEAWSSVLVKAMLRVYSVYGDRIDDRRMVRQMQKVTVPALLSDSGRWIGDAVGRLISSVVNQYNKGARETHKLEMHLAEAARKRGQAEDGGGED